MMLKKFQNSFSAIGVMLILLIGSACSSNPTTSAVQRGTTQNIPLQITVSDHLPALDNSKNNINFQRSKEANDNNLGYNCVS